MERVTDKIVICTILKLSIKRTPAKFIRSGSAPCLVVPGGRTKSATQILPASAKLGNKIEKFSDRG